MYAMRTIFSTTVCRHISVCSFGQCSMTTALSFPLELKRQPGRQLSTLFPRYPTTLFSVTSSSVTLHPIAIVSVDTHGYIHIALYYIIFEEHFHIILNACTTRTGFWPSTPAYTGHDGKTVIVTAFRHQQHRIRTRRGSSITTSSPSRCIVARCDLLQSRILD